jgi:hypothetical protein
MTIDDIAAIMRRLDVVDESHREIKDEIVAVKAWQTVRDTAEHDRLVRLDAYKGLYRWVLMAWRSDFAKFALALVLAGAGTRVI